MDDIMNRIREHALDSLDWIDYRRDPHYWPYLLLVLALGLAFFTPMGLGPFLVMATLGLTFVLVVVCAVFVGLKVAFEGLVEHWSVQRRFE